MKFPVQFKSRLAQAGVISTVFGAQLVAIALSSQIAQAKTFTFRPPRNFGAPRWAIGGASRGHSLNRQANAQMSVLVPNASQGVTNIDRPEFIGYLPASSAKQILFTLKNGANIHYQATLPVSGNKEVLNIQLPAAIAPLEADKNYQWDLTLLCESKLQACPTATGTIKFVPSGNAR